MKIPKMQWVIAAMLFFATAINYGDRLALSIVSHNMRVEFSMSEQDYALVVTIFLFAYAIMYAGSGYVVDRLGTRLGFAVFVFVWSLGIVRAASGSSSRYGFTTGPDRRTYRVPSRVSRATSAWVSDPR